MAKGNSGVTTGLAQRAKGVALIAAGAGVIVANAALACKLHALDLHVVPTASGLARIYTVRDAAGERVRVLNVGGAYQSATYLGERWAEPPIAYYRSFDHMFEAERGAVGAETRAAGASAEAVAAGAADAKAQADAVRASAGEAKRGDADAAQTQSAAAQAPARETATTGLHIRDVLMIGGGGCTWPKHALTVRPNLHVDVVESDPAMAALARRYFFVDKLERTLREREGASSRFNLIVDDGLGYLAGCEKRYDAICNDAFSGKTASGDLASSAGIRAVKDHLVHGGLYLINVVSDARWREFRHLIRLINELDRQFSHVEVIFATDEEYGGKDNYLVVASDEPYAFTGVIPAPKEF